MDNRILRLKQQGQDYYRKQEHQKALECFNEIINQYAGVPLDIYDNRAAVHSKLGNLKSALRDGEHIIRMQKNDAAGYLRTGQILQKMEKDETALGIYRYGIRNVPLTAPNAALLRSMHEKLRAKCAPPQSVDPFTVLPVEMIALVATSLTFAQLVSATRVSKQWRDVLCSQPQLWRRLDLSRARRGVGMYAVKAYVQNARRKLTHANLSLLASNTERVVQNIIANSPKLTHLEVLNGRGEIFPPVRLAPHLTTIITGPAFEVTLDRVSHMLHGCKSLSHAEFHSMTVGGPIEWKESFPGIQSLTLSGKPNNGWHQNGPIDLAPLLAKLPNVQCLTIRHFDISSSVRERDFSVLQKLKSLTYGCYEREEYLLTVPRSVERIFVESVVYEICANEEQPGNMLEPPLPPLTELSLGEVRELEADELPFLLAASAGKLAGLHLAHAKEWDFATTFLHECTSERPAALGADRVLGPSFFAALEALTLRACNVDDRALELVAVACPRLRTLDVSNNLNLTGAGVVSVVQKRGEKLRELNLTNCSGVSADTVTWAREKGVQVTYRFPDVKSGKKLRTVY